MTKYYTLQGGTFATLDATAKYPAAITISVGRGWIRLSKKSLTDLLRLLSRPDVQAFIEALPEDD